MATIKFSVKIPDWIYRYRWENIKKWISYHLKPYRCDVCGKKMAFRVFDIWAASGYPLKQRLGASYYIPKKCVCQECTLDILNAATDSPLFEIYQEREYYNVRGKCDVCENERQSYKAIKMPEDPGGSIRFCTKGSWNGHYVCEYCAKVALKFGKQSSGIVTRYKGEEASLNSYGLPVVDGKVKFPER